MKVRRVVVHEHQGCKHRLMYEADAPDGALNLDLDARLMPDGTDHGAGIDMIDYDEGVYTRKDSSRRYPIPDKVFHADDLDWRFVREVHS